MRDLSAVEISAAQIMHLILLSKRAKLTLSLITIIFCNSVSLKRLSAMVVILVSYIFKLTSELVDRSACLES